MVHSTATQLLPYLEQQAVYDMFDHVASPAAFGATATAAGWNANGALLHANATGRPYNDPANPRWQQAAKTQITTFVCASTPLKPSARDPQHKYGGWDYMFVALTDVDERTGTTFKQRTVPAGSAAWLSQVVPGMLTCDGARFANTTDGTSNTILCIEDAGRAFPTVGKFGAASARVSPLASSADPMPGNLRRVFAWADPDAVTNGFSGPNNATVASDRVAKVNNHKFPIGGPTSCPWSTNNCGPNDEPFSFHPGGVNVVMGDGSVRFIIDTMDALLLKALCGANDGKAIPIE